jgi:hypothetical protein
MSSVAKHSKLIDIKLALAKKYETMAATSASKPKKKRLMHHAGRFRRQATDLSRLG